MILASGEARIRGMMEPSYRILDGKGMPADWAASVVISIIKGK